jgi:hypothetical protein
MDKTDDAGRILRGKGVALERSLLGALALAFIGHVLMKSLVRHGRPIGLHYFRWARV